MQLQNWYTIYYCTAWANQKPTESKSMNSFEGLNITPPYITNLQGNNAFYTTLLFKFNIKRHMGYYGEDVLIY